jgi:RNA-directed DNA polymerase
MNEPLATYEWKQIPWRKLEISVFKLQRRIYRASHNGESRKVHQLQRLLLKSRAAQFLAVRRVTQDNQGKKTAGIDGIKSLNPQQRFALADNLSRLPYGKPLRRVWIPKRGTKEKRPLGIPTPDDRALQALVKRALEPEWEAKFEPNSYGFRPGRSPHDALGAIFIAINQQPKYVLDADIAQCFDRIDHAALLQKLATFPRLTRLITRWLKAGILDQGVFTETEAGTPQGGIASPLLANIALHGLEAHIRSKFPEQIRLDVTIEPTLANWKPQVIRYADDLVIFHRDRAVIETCQHLTEEWLQRIGLALHPKKTRLAHTLLDTEGTIGFDFLGFAVRQYRGSRFNTGTGRGFKTLIKPSADAIKRHGKELSECMHRNQAAKQENLIGLLNPKIAGWSNYYRAVVSTQVFQKLDHQLYVKLDKWARYRHPRKSRHWISRRYWHIEPGQGWIFGKRHGLALNQHASIAIVRHAKVRGAASPYDGNWSYWASRCGTYPGVPRRLASLLKKQKGPCQECGLFFMPDALVDLHHLDGNRHHNKYINLAAVHRHCHDRIHGGQSELSKRIGTHDKSPINRGAVCCKSGMHGSEDQREG